MLTAARKQLALTRRTLAYHIPSRSLTYQAQVRPARHVRQVASSPAKRTFVATAGRGKEASTDREVPQHPNEEDEDAIPAEELNSVGTHEQKHEHAVISAFDLFSIGGASSATLTFGQMGLPGLVAEPHLRERAVGPSSSHTVGPMRAGKIFIGDLEALGLLEKVGLQPVVRHMHRAR